MQTLLLIIFHFFISWQSCKIQGIWISEKFCHLFFPLPLPHLLSWWCLYLASCYSETSNLLKAISRDLTRVTRNHKGLNAFPPFPQVCSSCWALSPRYSMFPGTSWCATTAGCECALTGSVQCKAPGLQRGQCPIPASCESLFLLPDSPLSRKSSNTAPEPAQ